MDSLAVLGNVLEEFMDLVPDEGEETREDWQAQRNRIEVAL